MAGVQDSLQGTVSFWARVSSAIVGSSAYLFAVRDASDAAGFRGFQVTKGTTGVWIVQGRNTANSLRMSLLGTTNAHTLGWHHVVASWTSGSGRILVNGLDDTAGGSVFLTGSDLDYTRGLNTLFQADAPATSGQFQGDVYDFAFWPGLFVDLTDAEEVRKFISSDGLTSSDGDFANPGPTAGTRKPVGYPLGDLGQPAVFFTGGFTHNMGTAGPFQDRAAFDESTTEPVVYRQSSSPLARPGERSFDSEKSGFTYPRHLTFVERREGNPDYGLRMGFDERSAPTRDDNPGYRLSHFIFQDREEDDEEYDR